MKTGYLLGGLQPPTGTVDRSFALKSTDLTPEGLAVLRKGWEKWHRQAKTPEDVRPWEKALLSVRAGE